jgi:hypothetical protein
VIAAPFRSERSSPELFAELVRRLGSDVSLVYIDVPDHIVRGRMESRGAPRDRAKLSLTKSAPPAAQSSPASLVPEAIVIDGTRDLTEQVTEALEAIGRQHKRQDTQRQAPC